MLAGGSGSRMGFTEKPLLRICGKRIVDRIASISQNLGLPMMIVCNERNYGIYREVARELKAKTGVNVRVAVDVISGFGPIAGIYTALIECDSGSVVAVGGDMPFVRKDVVSFLFSRGEEIGCDALIPERNGRKEPLLAYYSTTSLPAFERAIKKGMRRIISAVEFMRKAVFLSVDELRKVDEELISFFNVNSPEDLKRAEEICSSTGLEGE